MLAKKTSKSQLTLPKKIVEALPETDYFDVSLRQGAIVLRPVTITEPGSKLATIRRKIRELGLTSKDIDDAISWARARVRDSRGSGHRFWRLIESRRKQSTITIADMRRRVGTSRAQGSKCR